MLMDARMGAGGAGNAGAPSNPPVQSAMCAWNQASMSFQALVACSSL